MGACSQCEYFVCYFIWRLAKSRRQKQFIANDSFHKGRPTGVLACLRLGRAE